MLSLHAGKRALALLSSKSKPPAILAANFHASPQSRNNEEAAAAAAPEIPPIIWTTHLLKPEQIEKVDSVFHKLLWLDMFETHMLTCLVNERMGIKLSQKQSKALERQMLAREKGQHAMSGDTSEGGSAAAEEPVAAKVVDLKLTGYDTKSKIKVIKEVRSIAGLGLKEAKELVEGAPKIIQKGIKPEVAEELKAKLVAIGAEIEIV
jgi:large subunit ribosomal protein L7/L12